MKRAERAVQPSDEEVSEKIKLVLHRMNEVVEKVYPSPIPLTYIHVPFNDKDTLFIIFGKAVRIPSIFFPSYTDITTLLLNRRRTIRIVVINFADGKIRSVEFVDDEGKKVFHDPVGDAALTHMLIPDVYKAVRDSYIYSRNPYAEEWFKAFIDAVEFVSQMDDVKQIDPIDLLNRFGRTEIFDVRIIKPVKNLEELLIRINKEKNILSLEMFFHPYGRGFVDCEFSGNELRNVKISASMGASEDRVKRYLLLLPDNLFDSVKSSIKMFLDAYKLFRTAVSFLKL